MLAHDGEAILGWLREEDPSRLEELFRSADDTRRLHVGDEVHLRGLVEFSNRCFRRCAYCGIAAGTPRLRRYSMDSVEIMGCARRARDLGMGTVVLQSGEDRRLDVDWLADLIHALKSETGLAVTLSVGERGREDYELWREAGADRYLLRFETSHPGLYAEMHPDSYPLARRLSCLGQLRELGYELGTGFLVGLPGQSWEDLAGDLQVLAGLDPDMVGLGPWLPHPHAALARLKPSDLPDGQVPNDAATTLKALALVRLLLPGANLPSTTALAVADPEGGRAGGLRAGANVVMPNLTPARYRRHYSIYPGKSRGGSENVEELESLRSQLAALGRSVGEGRGDAPAFAARGSEADERKSP